jgi:hypothetical protein
MQGTFRGSSDLDAHQHAQRVLAAGPRLETRPITDDEHRNGGGLRYALGYAAEEPALLLALAECRNNEESRRHPAGNRDQLFIRNPGHGQGFDGDTEAGAEILGLRVESSSQRIVRFMQFSPRHPAPISDMHQGERDGEPHGHGSRSAGCEHGVF